MNKKTYFWRGTNGLRNFGDELTGAILKFLGVNPTLAPPSSSELVMVGSVLEHLPSAWAGTVCGAGKLRENSTIDLTNANVVALRGKLSAAGVRGVSNPVVLGDPALLMPRWVRQPLAKYDLGVVPHWSDHQLHGRFLYGHLISPTDPPEKVVEEISRCKRIVSSSLHGLIIADAYGIPRQAELFPNAHREGGDFKYRDYASIYDDHPHFGEMWRAPHDVVARIQDELFGVLKAVVHGVEHEVDKIEDAIEEWIDDRVLHHPQISLLVPFRDDGEHRSWVWDWMCRYWRSHLPSAEIIQGCDHHGTPFSKASAVNNAASRAHGRVFVIIDADTWIDPAVIQNCANNIDAAVAAERRLWYVPYRNLYRLNRRITLKLLRTNPDDFDPPSPPPADWFDPDNSHSYGHKYGAMIQIMPREAFDLVNGMDSRFRGWGGEDSSMLRALDTLYCQHEVTKNDVLHLWHDRPGKDYTTRRWVGQEVATNSRLAQRYGLATYEPAFMEGLVNERARYDEH